MKWRASGFSGTYTSNAIGLTHNFNSIVRFALKSGIIGTGIKPLILEKERDGPLWL